MSFVIAKQPVFNKKGQITAFEVYLRKKDNMYEYPKDVPYSRATFIILEIISEHGLERVGEGKRVIINLSVDSLLNKAISVLDPNKLILELIPPQISIGKVIYQNALRAMDHMMSSGALFSVTQELLQSGSYTDFYQRAGFLTVSVKKLSKDLVAKALADKKGLIITHIETEDEYKSALEVGVLFEGNYLGTPIILKEFQIAPYLKSTLLRLMAVIHTAQSTKEIAQIVSSDAGMSAKLLRLVNSAYFSPITEIKSIEQACSMLGLKNLKNFLMVFAMNDYMSVENPQLWKKSLIRAILAENIANAAHPKEANNAYLLGLFSLVDRILDVDKISFLKEVHVAHEIIDGFTGKNPTLRSILDTAVFLEEKSSEILSSEDAYTHPYLENVERQMGIDRSQLLYFLKDAMEKADYLLKL